jgi:hypothetical protein
VNRRDEVMAARSSASRESEHSRTNHFALLLIVAVTGSIACGSTSTDTTVAPSPVRCAVAATANPAAFPANGGSGSLVVSSARECSWSVTTETAWIALAPPATGQGDGTVRYTVASNTVASARRGALVLGTQSAEITQEAATCRFELDRSAFELSAGEQTATVNVRVATGCTWTSKAGVSWITIVEGAQGDGTGNVRFRVAANPATEPRSGSLEIAGLRVSVRQGGGVAPCSYDVVPASADAGPGQTDGSVSVRTDAPCAWTALSDQPWLTVVAGASGSGPGDVRYQAAANSSTSTRTGHITVNGAIFTLRQTACTYVIRPTSESFEARGGSGEIEVQTQAPCAWSAGTTDSWITITSRSNAPGDGRVGYQIAPNANIAPRTGTITVAGQPFTVAQQGEASISGGVEWVQGSCPNLRFSVNAQQIQTTSSTDYEDGDCGAVRQGVRVIVKGIIGTDGVLRAHEVDF